MRKESIIAHSTVAVLCVVAMVILSVLLPEANEANRLFIIISDYLFLAILLVQVVNIVSEVRSRL